MRTSETIGAIAKALASAQAEMKPAAKDSENPHFRSKYADIAAVIEAVRTPLAQHGLSFVQGVGSVDGDVLLTTRLMHESGEWIEDSLRMKPTQPNPQGVGSTITYARRYGLQSMVGLPAEDDDGNAASEKPEPAAKPARKAEPAAKTASKTASKTPQESARARLWTSLRRVAKDYPGALAYLASGDNESRAKVLWFLAQYHGTDIASSNDLSAEELHRIADAIDKDYPTPQEGA